MARITLDMPDTYIFTTKLNTRISDINYGNHLGHDAVVTLLHEARLRLFNSFGFTEADVDGTSIILSDLCVVYKAQAFYGDPLKIDMAAGDFSRHGCDLLYRVTHAKTRSLIAEAKTGIVFFDYVKNRVSRVPRRFEENLR